MACGNKRQEWPSGAGSIASVLRSDAVDLRILVHWTSDDSHPTLLPSKASHGRRACVHRLRFSGAANDIGDHAFRSKAEEKGVLHGSMIELSKRDARAGREDLRHILVVDDDPMVCMAIEIYLQRNNFRVTIAEGSEAGLRALEHEQFDLMIIDIFMPHMRSFESVRILRERAPRHSADRDVGLRFCKSEFARARSAPDGVRARRRTLPAQAVHAARIARRHQRLPGGASSRRRDDFVGATGLARQGPQQRRSNRSFTQDANFADLAKRDASVAE